MQAQNNWIAELKHKVNIVDLIQSDGIELRQEGHNRYVCRCPFHDEKTPSFKVNEDSQFFKCFGCGASGDAIKFYSLRNLIDYYTSARMLAKKYGVATGKIDNEQSNKIARLFRLLSKLEKFFIEEFDKLENEHPAKTEITKRKLTIPEKNKTYGFAPSNRQLLIDYALNNGFTLDDLRELGLYVKSTEDDSEYVLFGNRLIFFIRDYMGNVIGFSGRALSKQQETGHKYVNSKNSVIYDKSKAVYNIEKAKKQARKEKLIYLVEGQFDVIAMAEAGYKNTVASSGTALTKYQVKDLVRCTGDDGKIVLLLDGDKAGNEAMLKIFQNYSAIQSRLFIIRLPEGKDPCDYLQESRELPEKQLMIDYLYYSLLSGREFSELEQRNDFMIELQEKITQYIVDTQLKEQILKKGCMSTGMNFSKLKIKETKENKQSIYEFKKTDEERENKLKKSDLYFLASLSFLIVNKDTVPKGIVHIKNYPKKYQSFLRELKEKIHAEKFIAEDYENFKIANYLSENMNYEVMQDSNLSASHYLMLLEQAKKAERENARATEMSTLFSNIDGLKKEQVTEILKEYDRKREQAKMT